MANEIDLYDYDWNDLKNYPNIGIDNNNEIQHLSFNGNALLRPYNTKIILSDKAKKEWEKCKNDFFYFVKTYCKILTLQEGVVNINLRDYQIEFLNLLINERFIISSQSRRAGKTTTNALFIVWNIIFHNDFIAGITANRADLVKEIVQMVKSIFELLPPFLQVGIKKYNAGTIHLANGSKVVSSIMGPNSFRGLAISFLLVDECAWIDGDKYDGFIDSVMPTIATADNTKVVKISTPNGLNHFHKEVQEAKNGQNGYKYFEVTWRDIDFYTEEWAKEEIKKIGPLKFNQNYSCAFIGSSKTLLNADILNDLIKKKPLLENFITDNDKLYKEYNPNAIYAITVDSSKTVGKEDADNDYISVNVHELGNKIEQIYSYRTNEIHYTELAEIIYNIGEYFDFPLCIVENNEGAGTYTANTLVEKFDYPNMYYDPAHDGLEVGIRTKVSNRSIALTTLKKLIERKIYIVNDSSTIDEFFTFIKIGRKYQAQNKSTDDCVMSLALLMYVLMDNDNDLELTLDDYLEGEVEVTAEDEEQDLDFVASSKNSDNEDKSWLFS